MGRSQKNHSGILRYTRSSCGQALTACLVKEKNKSKELIVDAEDKVLKKLVTIISKFWGGSAAVLTPLEVLGG